MNQSRKKKLLILDIDNTLLFGVRHEAKFDPYQEDYCLLPTTDGFMHVPSHEISPGDKERYGLFNVYLRPHVRDFLRFCQQHFELAVFTTACQDHVVIATSYFFPDLQDGESPWLHVWISDDCMIRDKQKHKSLQFVVSQSGYKLENILVVDDQPDVWAASASGAIPANIIPTMEFGYDYFTEDSLEDSVLPALQQFLESLLEAGDILAVEKLHWENRYAHIINDRVSNGKSMCVVQPHPVSARGKAAGKHGLTWKWGYYTSLCGAEIEVKGARSDTAGKALCAKCAAINKKITMENVT